MLGRIRIVVFTGILVSFFCDGMTAQYDHFYDFGVSQEDNQLTIGSSGFASYVEIDLPREISFYGDKYTSILVHGYGILSLGRPIKGYIAPFLSSMSYKNGGHVWYRMSSTRQLRKRSKRDIRNNFASCGATFRLKFGLVVTYEEVDFNGNHDPECYAVRGRAYCHCMEANTRATETICNCVERLGNFYACECLAQTNFSYELCACMVDYRYQYYDCECLLSHDFDLAYCTYCFYTSNYVHRYCACYSTYGTSYCTCLIVSLNDPSYCNCTYLGDCSNSTRRDVETQALAGNMIEAEMSLIKADDSGRNGQKYKQLQERASEMEESFHSQETRAVQYLPRNTFQVVILSGGRQTFVIFNYGKISWTTSDSQDGVLGHGGNFSTVFFRSYDRAQKYMYTHPFSGSDDLHNLTSASNVGTPGVWMYRVDGNQILGPDCNPL